MNKKVTNAVKAAMMGAEAGVLPPTRARASSFASAVFDLEVGDQPASRVIQLDAAGTVAEHMADLAEQREKLRGSVTSAVSQAKRRNPDAQYSIEVTNFLGAFGIMIAALVRRTA